MEYYVPHFEVHLPLIIASIILVNKKPKAKEQDAVDNDYTLNVINYASDIKESEIETFYYGSKACHATVGSAQRYLVGCLFEYGP